MTIFAAAAIPIMIMGGALEIGKLVTAVWLHRYWSKATWWLKTYLTTAVVILMFITSMGIFGFLSKAHIEQTASANEGVAQLERIEAEIGRNEQIIARAEAKIQELETSGTGATNQLQEQIDREQERIAGAYDRIQPAIEEQNQIIAGVTQLFQQELDRIDDELARLQGFIDNNEIEKAQAMVGTAVDGDYGPKTAAAFTAFQDAKRAERNEWLQKIQNSADSPTVIAARKEIARLRASAEEQIAESNALINNLRNQLKSNDGNDLQTMLDEQNERVRSASNEIDLLFDQKFQLEAEYRKLEAEVGPVKYIAEFIYGENADNNLLEEAVRWVIITIIFVFDPLAVLLLIAAQYTFEFNRKPKDDGGERLRQEYEQARAQRIVDNPGYHTSTPTPPQEEKEHVDDDLIPGEFGASDNGRDSTDGMALAGKENVDETDTTTTNDIMGDMVSEDDTSDTDATDIKLESTEVQVDDDTKKDIARSYTEALDAYNDERLVTIQDKTNPVEVEKKDTESSDELKQVREKELESQESDESWQNAKHEWKTNNPALSLKTFKTLYLEGKIDKLPWEDYVKSKPHSYIMKDNGKQVEKETKDTTTGYIQNEEQNSETLWKRLKDDSGQ